MADNVLVTNLLHACANGNTLQERTVNMHNMVPKNDKPVTYRNIQKCMMYPADVAQRSLVTDHQHPASRDTPIGVWKRGKSSGAKNRYVLRSKNGARQELESPKPITFV